MSCASLGCWTGAAKYTESRLTKAMSDGRQPLQDHMACSEAGIDHTGHVIIKADRCKVKPHLYKTGQENVISDRKQWREQPVPTPGICCQSYLHELVMGLNPNTTYWDVGSPL